MEDKIWYRISNTKNYDYIPGLLLIHYSTFCSLENTIQSTIDSFNLNVQWEDMWDLEEAKERLKSGHKLFIGVDSEGTLSHVWFKNNYLYNVYVNPRRPDGYGVKFIQACMNFIDYENIELYCDEWNIKAQKFFEKVGFKRINSYI